MAEAEQPIIMINTPVRAFEACECSVSAVAVFPDRRLIVTALGDNTLRLWDLTSGVELKKMEGHQTWVGAVAVSRDGRLIASGDANGKLLAWHGNTGELLSDIDVQSNSVGFPLPKTFAIDSDVHSAWISSLDFSPGGALASGSGDKTTKLWNTKTWKLQEKINCGASVHCVRHSPSGELLAIATDKNIQIWTPGRRECIAKFKAHSAFNSSSNYSLTWTLDGTRLLSAGSATDPTIREWETSTWKQFGDPWKRHTGSVSAIAVDSTGTFVASASYDHHVYLWRLSDRRTIASFKHSDEVNSVTFSIDGKRVLSAGKDQMISEWAVPEDVLPDSKILDIDSTVRSACIICDWDTAEALLTQRIDIDDNDHIAYANRSLVRARKLDWDQALSDALKSVNIQPSFTGCISKGIAYCGKMEIRDAMKVFDLAFMFTKEDPKIIHYLLLIKAIACFNANQYEDAIQRVQELADTCPKVDTLACYIVEAYLRIKMGINALDGAYDNKDGDHFTAIADAIASTSQSAIHSDYDDFVVLFGWDLKSLWKIANQKRCDGLLRAHRLREAHESYRYMMNMCDEVTKLSCLGWATDFKQNCSALYAANGDAVLAASGDAALAASDYNKAIELYSAAIDLDSATDEIFAKRCKAKLEKMLWADAFLDAQKVIELSPSSYLGYQLKHAALYGAQRYDEAFQAFQVMLSKLDNSADAQLRELRRQYASPSEAGAAIRRIIDDRLEHTPLRLINTSTGHLYDREAQISAFKSSTEYEKLLLFTMMHGTPRIGDIKDAVMKYFGYVMLSHRWQMKEPMLYDIQDEDVYELNPLPGIVKLQRFCKTARAAGYRWAWSDTCCIDKRNYVELQKSVNSMFDWYRHSMLTIIYLADVPPSSQRGALANSEWNARSWTIGEILAPKVVLFYQRDWTLYLDDRSPNHKESVVIMQELQAATGIDERSLVAFQPGVTDAREKFRWASTRRATLQEDHVYSLFGIFGVHLPVDYGEKVQKALWRLLQEIVAQSGDVSVLDWVGKPSQFNSCLPASIMPYNTPPLPYLSEDDIQTTTSSLRVAVAEEVALKLYSMLYDMPAPRFSHRRLYLSCIMFHVTDVRQRHGQDQETCFTYDIKADGLHDFPITTEDKLDQFSQTRPTLQKFLLVRPWDHRLLELPDFSADVQSVDDWTPLPSPLLDSSCRFPVEQGLVASEPSEQENPHFTEIIEDYLTPPESPIHDSADWFHGEPVDLEYHRALRLIARLQQPFSALLLGQLQSGEYKRMASDCVIIAQVKDVCDIMDTETLEIL